MILKMHIPTNGGNYRKRLVTLARAIETWADLANSAEASEFCAGHAIVIPGTTKLDNVVMVCLLLNDPEGKE